MRASSRIHSALVAFILATLAPLALSCRVGPPPSPSPFEQARAEYATMRGQEGMVEAAFPAQDPGPPLYARVGPPLNQFLVAGDTLVIPFYRSPACVQEEFNLLEYFHVPFAFSCELTVQGTFLTENPEPLGPFPALVHTTGTAVPFWFVPWGEFVSAMADGVVTMAELEAMNPVRGTASRFEEYLRPRESEHQVVIEAEGTMEADGRRFSFTLHHTGDAIVDIGLHLD